MSLQTAEKKEAPCHTQYVEDILNKSYPNNVNVQFHETIHRGIAAKVPSLPKSNNYLI